MSVTPRSGFMVAAFGMVFQQAISFVSGVIVARVIGAAEYGVFTLARNIQQAVCLFSRLGLDISLQRFLGEAGPDSQVQRQRLAMIGQFRMLALVASLLPIALLVLGFGNWVEQSIYRYHDFANVLLLTFIAIPFLSDLAVLGGAYRGMLNPSPAIISEFIILPSVRLTSVLLLFACGLRLWGVVLGTSLASATAWLYLAWRFRSMQQHTSALAPKDVADQRQLGKTLRYSMVIALAMSVTLLTRSVDSYLLGYFTTATELGQYALVQMMLILIGLFGAALGQNLGAQIAAKFANSDSAGIEQLLERNVRLIALVSCPLFAVFFYWGADLVAIFGPSYQVRPDVVRWLAASSLLLTLMACAGFGLSMTGRHALELRILLVGLISSVGLCIWLIPAWGQLGAALSVFASLLLVNLLRLYAVWRALRVFHLRWIHLRTLGLAQLLAMPLSWTAGGVGLTRLVRAFAGASSYLLLYVVLSWILLSQTEKQAVKQFLKQKFKKA